MNSRAPIIKGGLDSLNYDYGVLLKIQYLDAAKEIDADIPDLFIQEVSITAFVDPDHAHNLVTRRSITGLIIVLGKMPVLFQSKWQDKIATSTCGAEFCALCTVVEEVQAVRYMLCCLGVKVTEVFLICGDSKGVI